MEVKHLLPTKTYKKWRENSWIFTTLYIILYQTLYYIVVAIYLLRNAFFSINSVLYMYLNKSVGMCSYGTYSVCSIIT